MHGGGGGGGGGRVGAMRRPSSAGSLHSFGPRGSHYTRGRSRGSASRAILISLVLVAAVGMLGRSVYSST